MIGLIKYSYSYSCSYSIQNTPVTMKDNTNALMGCISTNPRQMDVTENNHNSKININNRTKTNERTK